MTQRPGRFTHFARTFLDKPERRERKRLGLGGARLWEPDSLPAALELIRQQDAELTKAENDLDSARGWATLWFLCAAFATMAIFRI